LTVPAYITTAINRQTDRRTVDLYL